MLLFPIFASAEFTCSHSVKYRTSLRSVGCAKCHHCLREAHHNRARSRALTRAEVPCCALLLSHSLHRLCIRARPQHDHHGAVRAGIHGPAASNTVHYCGFDQMSRQSSSGRWLWSSESAIELAIFDIQYVSDFHHTVFGLFLESLFLASIYRRRTRARARRRRA